MDSLTKSTPQASNDAQQITMLLARWSNGEAAAFNDLIELLYPELHALAARYMERERPGHSLTTTALLHEACLRLMGSNVSWNSRAHFMAVAATTIRRILIDHARRRNGPRKNGNAVVQMMDDIESHVSASLNPDPTGILAVNEALDRLLEQDARKAKLMEMLYFGGLSREEAATVLCVSVPTVNRDLKLAKAWLRSFLTTHPSVVPSLLSTRAV